MYQRTVKIWTQDGLESEVSRHPHRQFFGLEFSYSLQISRGWDRPVLAQLRERIVKATWPEKTPEQISKLSVSDVCFPYGKMPFEEFLACREGGAAGVQHQTRSAVDVARLKRIFGQNGCHRSWFCKSQPAQSMIVRARVRGSRCHMIRFIPGTGGSYGSIWTTAGE